MPHYWHLTKDKKFKTMLACLNYRHNIWRISLARHSLQAVYVRAIGDKKNKELILDCERDSILVYIYDGLYLIANKWQKKTTWIDLSQSHKVKLVYSFHFAVNNLVLVYKVVCT